jgi:hypothetical protein
MNEHIVYVAIGILWTLVNVLFWTRINKIEKDIVSNDEKSEKIESNYLERFEKVNKAISDHREENQKSHALMEKVITEKITELEKSLIRELAKNGKY